MKKSEQEAYNEQAQFNLTKFIKKNYEAGNPLTKDSLEDIDFHEEAQKIFYLPINGKGNHRFEIKESLAINLVSLLPLKYYENLIDATWIVNPSINDNGVVHRALYYEDKYDFIYHIIPICKNYLAEHSDQNNREDQKFIAAYEHFLMSPILDIGGKLGALRSFKASQEEYDKYFELFKTTLKDFKEYYDKKMGPMALFSKEEFSFNENKWFAEYRKMETLFRRFTRKDTLINHLVTNPKAFSIYKECFSHYDSKENNPFLNIKTLQTAFESGNKKVVAHLCQQSVFTSSEINFVFEEILRDWLANEKEKPNRGFKNKLEDCSSYLKSIIEIVQKNHPSHQVENFELFSHVLASSNQKLVDDILNLYPNINEAKLEYGLTLNQWEYAKNLFNEFLECENLKITKSDNGCNYPSYDYYYLQNLTKHIIPSKELTPDEKLAVNEVIANYYLPLLGGNLDDTERATIFYKFTLHKQMPEKTDERKKLKI